MSSQGILKQLIWLYFWLLIFEGALRKWVLPGLASPLLLVRDPIVIAALVLAFSSGRMKINGYLAVTAFVAFVAPLLALTLGHGNLVVTIFGWRACFLHFPFIFLMAQVLETEDVKKMGWWFLIIAMPMILLMMQQFYSPQGAWVNLGIGGEGDSGFDGAMGYRRPSATFSFIVGPAMFFPLVAAFALYLATQPRAGGKWLAVAAGMATLAAIPVSISRSLLLGVVVVAAGAALAMARSGRSVRRLVQAAVLLGIVFAGASFIPGLEKPREAFLSRWDAATTQRGGVEEAVIGRLIDGMLGGLRVPDQNFLTGAGLGMGTNAGARLLTGRVSFLISEGEWGRLTGEMGLPLGLLFIGVRVSLAAALFLGAWRTARRGEPLALILWFAAAMPLTQGQWGQPTALGFSILGAGLVLAVIESEKRARRRILDMDSETLEEINDPVLAQSVTRS